MQCLKAKSPCAHALSIIVLGCPSCKRDRMFPLSFPERALFVSPSSSILGLFIHLNKATLLSLPPLQRLCLIPFIAYQHQPLLLHPLTPISLSEQPSTSFPHKAHLSHNSVPSHQNHTVCLKISFAQIFFPLALHIMSLLLSIRRPCKTL